MTLTEARTLEPLAINEDIDRAVNELEDAGRLVEAGQRLVRNCHARKRREFTVRVMSWGYNGNRDTVLEAEFQARLEKERQFNASRQGNLQASNGHVATAKASQSIHASSRQLDAGFSGADHADKPAQQANALGREVANGQQAKRGGLAGRPNSGVASGRR